MVANINTALNAYASAASRAIQPAGDGPEESGDAHGPSFGAMLEQAARGTLGTLKAGEQMTAKAAVGKADLNDVVTAITNAEVTLQTVTAVRDKVVTAYQQILQMPI
ncbi:MAG: flagellar hook-basal body complex protein FliE [Rhodospirillaceae bacterium]